MKYRIYQKSAKKYVENAADYAVMPDGVIIYNYDHWEWCVVEYQDDFVVETFTGLVDSDGKDIYEGDICCFHLGHIRSEVGTIVYENYGFCFFGPKIHGTYLGILESGFPKGFEIIGNTLENPELLEK